MTMLKYVPKNAYIYEDVEAAKIDPGGERDLKYYNEAMAFLPGGIEEVGRRVGGIDYFHAKFEQDRQSADILDMDVFKIKWRLIK